MAQKYTDKFQKFVTDNPEFIAKYNSIEGVVPLEYDIFSVIEGFESIKNKNQLDFISILRSAVNNSIKYQIPIEESFDILASTSEDTHINTIQQYFKEINDIYIKNDNNYNIEFCEENRDKIINMNLKMVISIAKRYQGFGLSLEELISAGNEGLVIAFKKFKPEKSHLKNDILDAISTLPDTFSYNELLQHMDKYLTYGEVRAKFDETFQAGNTYTKAMVTKWINSNIQNAKFSSVAAMWIRAFILNEIDNCSRIIRKPKVEICKDKKIYGAYQKEKRVDIDSPISDSSDTPLSDIFQVEDDTPSDLDESEAYDIYKNGLNLLLTGVKHRDRSILLKKFGIGLPRPMLPREIAEQEGLSIARVSQIFQNVMEIMQRNQSKYHVDPKILLEAVKNIK